MKPSLATTLVHMQSLVVPPGFDEDVADAAIQLRLQQIYDANRGHAPSSQSSKPNSLTNRRRIQRSFAGVLVIASVVAAILIHAEPSRDPSRQLVLVAAKGTEILTADGKPVAIKLGAVLQEGSVIRVGTRGSITIGTVTLSGGAVAHVEDGRVVIDIPGVTTTTQTTRPTPNEAPGVQSTTTPPSTATPIPTVAPSIATTSTSPRSQTSTSLPEVTTSASVPATFSVTARLRTSQGTLSVEWRWPNGDRVAGIVVIGHAPGTDPAYPLVAGSGTARLFSTQSRTSNATTIRWVGGARILVIAVDRNRRMLGQSIVLVAPLR